jgi:uncharacterized protein (DUF1800 family)
MPVDDELFFARRLGYGLRAGETIGSDIRTWALNQLAQVPALDFYGPDGTSLRKDFPDFAEPTLDDAAAAEIWGTAEDREIKLLPKAGTMPDKEFETLMNTEVYFLRGEYPAWRDCLVRSLTAVNGPSPVFERFWSFWVNHFTVAPSGQEKVFYGPHIRGIRNAMTGNFRDMLHAAILSSGMLRYLDNWLSTGPNSDIGKANRETINENLARELLELHTISPSAGYTQEDIAETALILSGWGTNSGAANEHKAYRKMPKGTAFLVLRHEPGERTVMGKVYKPTGKGAQKGANQALELLDDLALDARTAEFISWKLVRHFVADIPPEDSVNRVRQAWLDSGGDLQTIHAAVVDEVIAKGRDNRKFTTPENWLFQVHRLTSVPLPRAEPWSGNYWIDLLYKELGQSFSDCPQPNGWSDLESDWVSRELLVRRARYSFQVGARVDSSPESLADLVAYAGRLAGQDSALVSQFQLAATPAIAAATLLCSPDFLRI